MTAEGDLTEAVAWRVLDQVADEVRKEVVKRGLKENQLDSLIEASLVWACSLGKTAAENAPSKPKMPSRFSAGTDGNPT